jgi:DnaJ-class molecular chaperone
MHLPARQLTSHCLPFSPLQYDLPVSLEELSAGCTKSVTHTRQVLTELGEVIKEQRTCTVQVAPGMRDGTAFVFQG